MPSAEIISQYEMPFINLAIRMFATRFGMTRQAAHQYLCKYQGLAFLIEFYNEEHLQSIDDTVDDLVIKCQQQGGTLA